MDTDKLREVRAYIDSVSPPIDWSANYFSIHKAYICSVFSELAYGAIPDYELKEAKTRNRVKIVPCFEYQKRILSGDRIDIGLLLREAGIEQYFVIQRRFAIVVGIRLKNLIIVAIRGTYELYDWLTNINVIRQKYTLTGTRDLMFHSGFFKASLACLQPLNSEIKKLSGSDHPPSNVPIYVTGHSLGGAMAAIIHTVWDVDVNDILYPYMPYGPRSLWSCGCYTFGMPRYGNLGAITLRPPYSLYHENDIVPLIPPRFLGFESCYNEYKLDGVGLEKKSQRETLTIIKWWGNLVKGIGIKDHNIELYRDHLFKQTQ